ncbi:MAG: type III secretion system export apparatus subunit SctS [Gammaproteobacteria bacterium]|nr:type III secretion system export apparatus subunit SctS [Gammaproteobacteria bacterium]
MESQVLEITQEALMLVLLLAGPPVIVASIVGLLIALIQAATQVQEQTFQFAAKFFAIALTIFVTASVAGTTLYHFSDRIFSDFPSLVTNR